MEYAIGYVVSVFVIQALAAWRTPHQDCQIVFVVSVFWPFFLVLVAASFLLDAVGWKFDVVRGPKMFGFRRPNDGHRGAALTVIHLEFQLWKNRG